MKSLVLTFDDGPDIRYTPVLLDLLKHENIPAAFFVMGNHAVNCPHFIRQMLADGHTVGLHTMNHKNALLSRPAFIRKDFSSCVRLYRELTGTNPVYFRPPWGISSPVTNQCIRHYHMKRVLWDVMAQDWESHTTSGIIADRLKQRVFDGAVLCLHDAGEDTGGAKGAPMRMIDALISVIPWLKSQGYQFLTLDQYVKGVTSHDIQPRKKKHPMAVIF